MLFVRIKKLCQLRFMKQNPVQIVNKTQNLQKKQQKGSYQQTTVASLRLTNDMTITMDEQETSIAHRLPS